MFVFFFRYQAMVHCGSIRQTASILTMSCECLRTGDKANVKFRFIKHPEYIKAGQRMVFREGRTKAVGNVLKPLPNLNNKAFQKELKKSSRGQQNQNPNVQPAAAFSGDPSRASLENVLEISTDKRNKNNRGGKRKRTGIGAQGAADSSESTTTATTAASSAGQTQATAKAQ